MIKVEAGEAGKECDGLTGGASNRALFITYHSSLKAPMTYVRLFTHVLGHVDWEHFIGNMMYILLLGPMLEEKYGSYFWRNRWILIK